MMTGTMTGRMVHGSQGSLCYGFQAPPWISNVIKGLNESPKWRGQGEVPSRHKERFTSHFNPRKSSSSDLKLYFQGTKLENPRDWKLFNMILI